MALEHGGKKVPADWAIEEFKVIYSKEPNKFYTFKTVITGSSKLAGTDANVFIEIAGQLGNTSVHRLYNPKAKKEFERNQTNHFHV